MSLVHSRHSIRVCWVHAKAKELGLEGWWVLLSMLGGGGRGGRGGVGEAWEKAQAAGKPSSETSEGGSLATAKKIVASKNMSMRAGMSTF